MILAVTTHPIRKSVPTASLESWWAISWAYVMPDFDRPDHSIIEWLSSKPAVEPVDPNAEKLAREVAAIAEELRGVG
jgi:hypothetical protein